MKCQRPHRALQIVVLLICCARMALGGCTHISNCSIGYNCVAPSCQPATSSCSVQSSKYGSPDGVYWIGASPATAQLAFCDMGLGAILCSTAQATRTGTTKDGSGLAIQFTSQLDFTTGVCTVWALRASDGYPLDSDATDTCAAIGFPMGVRGGLRSCSYGSSYTSCGFPGITTFYRYGYRCSGCTMNAGTFPRYVLQGPMSSAAVVTSFDGTVSLTCGALTAPASCSSASCNWRAASWSGSVEPFCTCVCLPHYHGPRCSSTFTVTSLPTVSTSAAANSATHTSSMTHSLPTMELSRSTTASLSRSETETEASKTVGVSYSLSGTQHRSGSTSQSSSPSVTHSTSDSRSFATPTIRNTSVSVSNSRSPSPTDSGRDFTQSVPMVFLERVATSNNGSATALFTSNTTAFVSVARLELASAVPLPEFELALFGAEFVDVPQQTHSNCALFPDAPHVLSAAATNASASAVTSNLNVTALWNYARCCLVLEPSGTHGANLHWTRSIPSSSVLNASHDAGSGWNASITVFLNTSCLQGRDAVFQGQETAALTPPFTIVVGYVPTTNSQSSIPPAVLTAKNVVAAVSVFSDPFLAMQANRATVALLLIVCDITPGPLPWYSSPIPLRVGLGDSAYYAGAVVGNLLTVGAILAVQCVVAQVLRRRYQLTEERANAVVRFPSLLILPILFLQQSTISASFVVFLWGGPAYVPVGVVGVLASLAPFALIPAYLRDGAFGGVYVAVDEKRSRAMRISQFLFGTGRWIDAPPFRYFKQRYQFLYTDYTDRWRWFLGVEMAMNVVCGTVQGLVYPGMCRSLLFVAAVGYFAFAAAAVVTRPFSSQFQTLFSIGMAVLQLLSVCFSLAAVQFNVPLAVDWATQTNVATLYLLLCQAVVQLWPKPRRLRRWYEFAQRIIAGKESQYELSLACAPMLLPTEPNEGELELVPIATAVFPEAACNNEEFGAMDVHLSDSDDSICTQPAAAPTGVPLAVPPLQVEEVSPAALADEDQECHQDKVETFLLPVAQEHVIDIVPNACLESMSDSTVAEAVAQIVAATYRDADLSDRILQHIVPQPLEEVDPLIRSQIYQQCEACCSRPNEAAGSAQVEMVQEFLSRLLMAETRDGSGRRAREDYSSMTREELFSLLLADGCVGVDLTKGQQAALCEASGTPRTEDTKSVAALLVSLRHPAASSLLQRFFS